MESTAFTIPILPGRTDECRLIASESMGKRRSEHAESRRKMTVGREFSWIQKTAADLLIIYYEADDLGTASERLATSRDPYDAWYREQLHYVTGVDFGDPSTEVPRPDTLCEVTGEIAAHAVPVATVVPLLPGMTEEARSWLQELRGPRSGELDDLARRAGLARASWYLQSAPDGNLLITFALVEDVEECYRGFALSDHPFDTWLKERLLKYTGIDYNAPSEGPLPHEETAELILDWHHAFEAAA